MDGNGDTERNRLPECDVNPYGHPDTKRGGVSDASRNRWGHDSAPAGSGGGGFNGHRHRDARER